VHSFETPHYLLKKAQAINRRLAFYHSPHFTLNLLRTWRANHGFDAVHTESKNIQPLACRA
jgi:murein tripeptide amidase MpaA